VRAAIQGLSSLLISPFSPQMNAILLSIQIGHPQTEGITGSTDALTKPHVTAIRKKPVTEPVRVLADTLEGDSVANRQLHGTEDKAVCSYPGEHYLYWQQVLQQTQPRDHGAFGENFTTQGLLETEVCVGDVYAIGTAIFSVSEPRQPCFTLSRHWQRHDFAKLVNKAGFTGWYFRVLQSGTVQAGEAITLVDRPLPRWSLARANDVMLRRDKSLDALQELASCPLLSADWRHQLNVKLKRALRETPELPGLQD